MRDAWPTSQPSLVSTERGRAPAWPTIEAAGVGEAWGEQRGGTCPPQSPPTLAQGPLPQVLVASVCPYSIWVSPWHLCVPMASGCPRGIWVSPWHLGVPVACWVLHGMKGVPMACCLSLWHAGYPRGIVGILPVA